MPTLKTDLLESNQITLRTNGGNAVITTDTSNKLYVNGAPIGSNSTDDEVLKYANFASLP